MNTYYPDRDITSQARYWFVRLESGEVTPEEEAEFHRWLNQDRKHYLAFQDVDCFCQGLQGLEHLAALDTVTPVSLGERDSTWVRILDGVRSLSNWRVGVVATAVLVMLVTGALWLQPGVDPVLHSTKIAEVRDIELSDGSIISLGARSTLSVQYSEDERKVTLTGGEAFFSVTPDNFRPFVVQIDDARVRVVGTQFNVHIGPHHSSVSVKKGIVDVVRPKPRLIPLLGKFWPQERHLIAGQQIAVPREKGGALSDVRPVDLADPGSWRSGRLIYRNARLEDVVEDAQRYSPIDILLADSKLRDLTLTASFQAGQIDNMLNGLSELLPVSVDREMRGRVVIKSAQSN